MGNRSEALERRDRRLAERTIEQDEAIDRLEVEIENDVGVMIVKRQPVAYDLRQVMAPFRIATDLERIGDLGKNIAKRTLAMGSEAPPRQLMLGLKHMGELALAQLKEVLDAFMSATPIMPSRSGTKTRASIRPITPCSANYSPT